MIGWDPIRPSALRPKLRRLGFRPSRRLGQNFLIDGNVLARLLAVAEVEPSEGVLEIGPGAGALTRRLAERADRVVAVEIDQRLRPVLACALAGLDNARVIFADALTLDWRELLAGHSAWKFVANVPYAITSPLLVRALQMEPRFRRIVMMVQREVAERLTAPPGDKAYGALTLLANFYAEVRFAFTVSPRSFWPQPKVWSAVVVLVPKPRSPDWPEPKAFFETVRAAFTQRRKMLRNALASWAELGLSRDQVEQALQLAAIDGSRRGETLSTSEFADLTRAIQQLRGESMR